MRILLAVPLEDYGRPGAGMSYEYSSFHRPLVDLGHEVQHFDTFDQSFVGQPDVAQSTLLDRAAEFAPDVVLTMSYDDEITLTTLDRLRRDSTVVNWFADDTWRFKSYSRHRAAHYDLVVTTSRAAMDRYATMPGVRAIFRPWGYDPDIYHPVDIEPIHDVGFVGQRYGRRGATIEGLIGLGYSVAVRGSGWPEGRVDNADLAKQFASTRINLNFLESSAGPFQRRGLSRFRGTWRADRLITRWFPPPTQLKARPFEITACGGFVLTNSAPELPEFFTEGTDLAVFHHERDLPRLIDHYLANEDERRTVAASGLQRSTGRTWQSILSDVLEAAA